MNTRLRFPLLLILMLVVITACGERNARPVTRRAVVSPVLVYVTPTPDPNATPLPSPEVIYVTATPPVIYVTATPHAESTPVQAATTPTPSLRAAPTEIAQEPTATPTVSGGFGPVIGPNYTPEPLHTALPSTLRTRPCPAIIAAPQVTLHAEPDPASQVTGTASARQRLEVVEVRNGADGSRWARTGSGWLMLGDQAALDNMRSCEILLGNLPDTTLLGLHVISGTGDDEVLNMVRRLRDAGHPLGTIKGVNGTEGLLTEVKRISPETITVYRSLLTPEGMFDCPQSLFTGEPLPEPEAAAREWMDKIMLTWDTVNPDYYEFINECPAPMDWLARFSIEAMRIAGEEGRCLLLFGFPGGTPPMEAFEQLLPAYQYALDHPCASGRYHGISMHAYSLEDTRLASESDVWLVFRHRLMYERLLEKLPDGVKLPVFITEFGIGGGTIFPGCDNVIRDALQYTYQLEEDPYVLGFHLWSVGSGAQWYDITPCLDSLTASLINYYEAE